MNEKLRTDVNNGITLCKTCHKEFHDIYGYTNNTKEQLDMYINSKRTLIQVFFFICKNKYDNQMLEVTGRVDSVGTDILNETYVCLGHDNEFTFIGVQCYAKDKETIEQIAQLKEGETITIRGKADVGSLSVSMENITIVK